MIDTLPELMEYLDQRGERYGIDGQELYEAIPEDARKPTVAYKYMQEKDISHKVPLSKGGDPAGDNWILEDSSVNRARGDREMTHSEELEAMTDSHQDVKRLLKQSATGLCYGGSMAAGAAIVNTTVAATTTASGIAATAVGIAALPAVIATVAIGGAGWGIYRFLRSD